MDALRDLVDKAIERCSPSNGAELARRMGLSRSSVSLWKQGKHIEPKHLTALIHIAQADATVAIQVLQEQSHSRNERDVWSKLAKQLGVAAMVAIVALMPFPSVAKATVVLAEQSQVICIMRNEWARKLARALHLFRTFVTERLHGTSPVLA